MSCNQTLTVGDIAQVFDGPHATPKKIEAGPYFLSISSLENGKLDLSKSAHVSDEDFKKWTRRVKPEEGDILFSYETRLGEVAMMPAGVTACLGRRMGLLRPDRTKILPEYLLYAYQSPAFQETIRSKTIHGATVDRIALKELPSFPIQVPPILEQEKIVNVLKGYDRKLILNAETNKTLEQMAQAIFKSWFIDFDPVKAKMNGEQPEGMDAATASLFPEKLDSETGIPVGWSQGVIADIAKLNAKSWTKKNQPAQVHYVDLANTKNGVIETVTTYDFDDAPSRARRILNSGDTIVGTVRPGNRSFAFIGETEQPLTGSTGFAVLSPKEEFWTSFVYLATTNDDSIYEYARLADGGAYPAIKPVVVADTPCVIPTTNIAQKFWQLTGAMLKKAHQNRCENEELAKLRDTLLPKLLSGDIELNANTDGSQEVNVNFDVEEIDSFIKSLQKELKEEDKLSLIYDPFYLEPIVTWMENKDALPYSIVLKIEDALESLNRYIPRYYDYNGFSGSQDEVDEKIQYAIQYGEYAYVATMTKYCMHLARKAYLQAMCSVLSLGSSPLISDVRYALRISGFDVEQMGADISDWFMDIGETHPEKPYVKMKFDGEAWILTFPDMGLRSDFSDCTKAGYESISQIISEAFACSVSVVEI